MIYRIGLANLNELESKIIAGCTQASSSTSHIKTLGIPNKKYCVHVFNHRDGKITYGFLEFNLVNTLLTYPNEEHVFGNKKFEI